MDKTTNISLGQEADAILWRQFKNGDPEALGKLAEMHYQALYNYGTKFTRDTEFIRDCIQELYVGLWEKRSSISETPFVKSYLFKSLRHRIFKESARIKRFQQPEDIAFDSSDIEHSVEAFIIKDDHERFQMAQLDRVISGLTNRQREVIYLRFYQGLEHETITEIMGLERQSLSNLLHRTLKEMKEQWPLSELLAFLMFIVE